MLGGAETEIFEETPEKSEWRMALGIFSERNHFRYDSRNLKENPF